MAKRKRQKRKKQKKKQPMYRGPALEVTISVCMIAKDEAAFLARCLESVQGLADEIVVGDTGSADETAEVARAAGARVLDVPWTGNFAAARNAVLAEAQCDWVLVMDCDEVLAQEDLGAIRKAAASGRAAGYRMTTRNYLRDSDRVGWRACRGEYQEEKEYPGWFPTTKVRLFQNNPRIRFEGALHELVERSIEAMGERIGDCSAPVHHYGYVEKDSGGEKLEAYLDAARRKAAAEPGDAKAQYELALALRDAGKPGEAFAAVERCLENMGEMRSLPYLSRDHALLVKADILGRMGDRAGEEQTYRRALEVNPESFEALNNLGTIRLRAGALEEARALYGRALELAPEVEAIRMNLETAKERMERGNGVRVPESGTISGSGRLSVCLIVRDEEAVLGRCLESVLGVADEIVVVDTGSADRSVEIARSHGARVFRREWADDFSAARNAGLAQATGDWILWLDADEYLRPEDREKVARAKTLDRDRALMFTLVNEGADRSRFRQVKMFPNRKEIRFERPVHETVLPSIRRLGMEVAGTDVEVRHTGYADAGAAKKKGARYFELMEKWLVNHPGDHDIRFRTGHTLYMQGKRKAAADRFRQVVEAGREAVEPESLFRAARTFLGKCMLEEGDLRAAVLHLEAAVAMKLDDALAQLSLGEAYRGLGDNGKAEAHFRLALKGKVEPGLPLDADRVFEAAREMSKSAAEDPVPGKDGARLSLCMIVKNEEKRLGNCLESVRGLVDEIVVVDTGSTDNTVAVAERFGAKLGYFEWCDDFSAARNESLRLATGDWILWLDADDLLPQESHGKIRKLVNGRQDRSYLFVLDSRGYEAVSCLQMRLFPNLPGVKFTMPVHEQVAPSLAELGVKAEATDVRVVHTGYTTREVVREKMTRYLGIMERWLETHPGDYLVRANVAMTHYVRGNLDTSIAHYEKILHESDCRKDANLVIETTAWLYLGRCYLRKKEYGQALEFLQKARELDDQYAVTNLALGECYFKMGRVQDALKALEQAQVYEEQLTFAATDSRALKYWIRFYFGQCMEAREKLEEAARYYREASRAKEDRSEALGALSSVCRRLGRREEAVTALEAALKLNPEDARHRFNRGTFFLEEGRMDQAEAWFGKALEVAPDMAEPYLNLGLIARRRGEVEKAEELYRRAVDLNGGSYEPLANLAHLLLDLERYGEAAEAFERVREKRPGLLDVDLGLCVACAAEEAVDRVRERTEAVVRAVYGEALQMALPANTGRGELAQLLGECGRMLLAKQLPVCARLAYLAAHLLDPGSKELALQLAEVFRSTGEARRAAPLYELLIQAEPANADLFRRLGQCYEAMGVPEAARLCAQQVAALEGRGAAVNR